MMKNNFYFSFLRYLNFYLDFLVLWENDWIRKLRLISKFMALETSSQTTAIHISPNNPQNKGNEKIKFGQLIKYHVKIIFI